jgi:hypothetical protein
MLNFLWSETLTRDTLRSPNHLLIIALTTTSVSPTQEIPAWHEAKKPEGLVNQLQNHRNCIYNMQMRIRARPEEGLPIVRMNLEHFSGKGRSKPGL